MTGQRWDHGRYCDAVELEVTGFADAVRGGDLDAPVPSCPGWSVADLLRHLGGVHRWAGGIVRTAAPRRLRLRDLGVVFPDEPADHLPWFEEGAAELVETLRAAGPDTPMWTWGPGGRADFWSRRMLHETAVHRCDADLAFGREPVVPPEAAADGLDELLTNLESVAAFSPKINNLQGSGETLAFTATDLGVRWLFRLLPDGFAWSRDGAVDDPADAVVRGGVSDLFLFVWGRRKPGDPRLEFTGDDGPLIRWVENSAIG